MGTTMLTLAVIGLVIPALFHVVAEGSRTSGEQELSLEIAMVLMLTYILSLFFTLKTHKHLYAGGHGDGCRRRDRHRGVVDRQGDQPYCLSAPHSSP
jgi:calcium/proton exchanger cax